MFNFSAHNLTLVSFSEFVKYTVFILKDNDTCRCYKVYDFSKSLTLLPDTLYCIFGKVNTADKLYLVLDGAKIDKKSAHKM